jgi:acyl carrier protein
MDAQMRAEILTQLARISEHDLDVERLRDEELLQDLGIDSLDAIMLVLDFEESYDIEVSGDELASLDTIGSVFALLGAKRLRDAPGS